jgi:hypothetical protein
MATTKEKWQEIANRGLQDKFDPATRAKFDEAVNRGLITLQQQEEQNVDDTIVDSVGGTSPERLGDFTGASVVEPLATVVTSAIAEPVAGLAGLVQAVNPFAEEGSGARVVEATREAFTYKPKTEAGQESLESVGEVLKPVGELFEGAETFLGDKTFEATGSPTLAAMAKSVPTLFAELLGVVAGKQAVKATQNIKRSAAQGKIAREISDAVPSINQLKDTSRAVFKEIDSLGASLQPKAYNGLVNKLNKVSRSLGVDADVTPLASKALGKFVAKLDESPSLTEVDNLRTIAGNVAGSANRQEAAIGIAMVNAIDETLDKFSPTAFSRVAGSTEDIGKRYKVARDLWGRARRSELLEEAFTKARLQASGFENGVRTQFRSILNNKKTRRFFKPDEIKAMTRVVKGDKKENFARLVGKLGFSEGNASNLVGGSIGVAGGAAVGGPVGAVAVPLIGQVSRKLAQRMTVKNAEFADQVIRAGKDAKKIATAYIKNTPKAQRSAQELSELLMRPDIDLSLLPLTDLTKQAAQITTQNRAALVGALTASQQGTSQ